MGLYEILATLAAAVGWLTALLLLVKAGYLSKLLVKLGIKEPQAKTNWTAFSWESCLQKLEYKADIVFFGDSIVRGGDFHKAFQEQKIINLGCSGDTLTGMINRVGMIKAVSPKKVFLMAGINGLTDYNVSACLKKYEELLDAIQTAEPDAQIYIHSVLPISKKKESSICKNSTIQQFNHKIKEIAQMRDICYIDLHPLYEKNGEMDPELTKEGLHLLPEAYDRWIHAIRGYVEQSSEYHTTAP